MSRVLKKTTQIGIMYRRPLIEQFTRLQNIDYANETFSMSKLVANSNIIVEKYAIPKLYNELTIHDILYIFNVLKENHIMADVNFFNLIGQKINPINHFIFFEITNITVDDKIALCGILRGFTKDTLLRQEFEIPVEQIYYGEKLKFDNESYVSLMLSPAYGYAMYKMY